MKTANDIKTALEFYYNIFLLILLVINFKEKPFLIHLMFNGLELYLVILEKFVLI